MDHALSASPQPIQATALVRPLARLLRPLLRLMIRGGLTFPVFAELVRGLYVQVAAEELGAARTDSRLSLASGVHRKEIRRLREQPPDAPSVPPVVTLGSQVVARWLGLPGHADAAGNPLPLPRQAPPGVPSFEALVSGVTRDVWPRSLLDEWLAQGLLALDAEGRVVLQRAAFVPRPGSDAQLYYFARNLHDHIAAAAANVAGASPAFLERAVHYDALPADIADRMEALGRAAAERMLVEVNREVMALLQEARGPNPPDAPTRRVNLGVYLWSEPESTGREA